MPMRFGLSANLSALGLALVGAAAPAFAQLPPKTSALGLKVQPIVNDRQIKLAPGVTTAMLALKNATPPASAFEDIRGTPIAHQPFPLMDPKTRKAVGRNDKITLPDGRQVPAGEYYDQLNAFEAYLNKNGHTLKNKTPLPVLRRAAVNDAALVTQTHTIGAFHKQLPKIELQRFSMATEKAPLATQLKSLVSEGDAKKIGVSAQQYQTHIQQAATVSPSAVNPSHAFMIAKLPHYVALGRVPLPSARKAYPIHHTYPFNFELGSASNFQAYLRGKGSIDGVAYAIPNPPTPDDMNNSGSHFTFHGDATAGGAVFGAGFTLANANADFSSSAKTVSAKMNVSVVGQTIFNLNESAPGSWTKSQRFVKGADISTTIPIPIGPLSLNIKLGVHGEAGLEYGAGIYGGLPMVRVWVDPFVHTSVYIQGGVCVGASWLGVEGGVGANMTLINDDMSISGEAGVFWLFAFGIREKFVIHNKLDMLSGNVYAYVQFNHPCVPDFWNSCHNKATVNLFNWSGYHTEGDLIALDFSRPLPVN